MVDVSGKADTARTAVAGATVRLGPGAFAALDSAANAKGNVLATARLAGIMAAKRTSELIPLCHPLALSHVSVEMRERAETHEVQIEASASCVGATGVEMEALTAASVAALTVYDMCKAAHKGIVISDVRLLRKSGGRSGEWAAEPEGAR
jgi:cyclic pyranopterin phosphate synthase